ncbi:MAG: hypothetical protein Q8O34_10350 [Rhodocyclaceae bacterium]|nr:hypothetical protein [Rhodocyclaceae bacterium]
MVEHPGDYRWSSYRTNAHGEDNPPIRPHEVYLALGPDAASRQLVYRELFRYELDPGLVDDIRRATNGNFALGSSMFAEQITAALGRRAMPGKSGRPRKPAEPESRELFA